jgi:hypothetical protein
LYDPARTYSREFSSVKYVVDAKTHITGNLRRWKYFTKKNVRTEADTYSRLIQDGRVSIRKDFNILLGGNVKQL